MKKLFALVILFAAVMAFRVDVSAASTVFYSEDILTENAADYQEIQALEAQIIQKAMETLNINNARFPQKDLRVEYADAVKVYSGYYLFESDEVSAERVDEIVAGCSAKMGYEWLIPVYHEGRDAYIEVSVAKQKPLSGGEKANIPEDTVKLLEANVGKYIVKDAVRLTDRAYAMKYISDMQSRFMDAGKVRIFGSQTGFVRPVAVFVTDKGLNGVFSLGYSYPLPEYVPNSAIEVGELYDYDTIFYQLIDYINERDVGVFSIAPKRNVSRTPFFAAVLGLLVLIVASVILLPVIKEKHRRRILGC